MKKNTSKQANKKNLDIKNVDVDNINFNDNYVNFASRAGLGANNLLTRGEYSLTRLSQNRIKIEAMYRENWIVGMAVDSFAEDMTKGGIDIKGDVEPKKIQNLNKKLTQKGVWTALLDSIKWGRLYGGCCAMIDIEGQEPSSELEIESIDLGQFKGLRVYDRWQLQPSVNNIVQGGRDDVTPAFYTVVANQETQELSNVVWHHSRVIRFLGNKLPYYQALTEQWWGSSILERIHDIVQAFNEATMGAANLIQKAHYRVIQIDKLRSAISAGGKVQENLLKMFEMMRLMQNMEGVTLLDKEDVFNTYNYSFSGVTDIVEMFKSQIISALESTELRIGKNAGGLGSTGEGELRTYYGNILAKQESSNLREGLHKILLCLYRSEYAENAPASFDFDFVPLWQVSDKEKSEIASSKTATVTVAYEQGGISQQTYLQELKQISNDTGVFTNITEEEIENAKIEEPPAPDDYLKNNDLQSTILDQKSEENDKKNIFKKLKDYISG